MNASQADEERPRRDDEKGSATAYAAIIATGLGVVAVLVVGVAGLIRVEHEAERAADLAALSATAAALGGGDGCQVARRVARGNGSELRECTMTGEVATLVVTATVEAFGRRWRFHARARAAPADLVDGDPASGSLPQR